MATDARIPRRGASALAHRIRSRAVGLAVLGLAACWGAALAVRTLTSTPGIGVDAALDGFLRSHRFPPAIRIADVLAAIGGEPLSIVVAAAIALLILTRRGIAPAITFVAASALSEGDVQLLKWVSQRIGPGGDLYAGVGSFPSGHTANAAVIVVAAVVLLDSVPTRVLGAGYVVVMAASRTLLGAHWLTDTVVGALEGVSAAVLVWALAPPAASGQRRRTP